MGRDRGQPAHGRRKDAGPFLHGWSRAKLDERRCLDVEFVFVFGRDGEAFRDGADGGTAIEPDRDYEIVGEASQLQQIGDEDRKVGDARRAAEGASVKYPDEPGDDGPPVDAEMAAGGRVFGLTRSEKDRSDVDSGENGGASSFIDGERVGSIASAGIGIMRHGHEVGALGRRNEWRSPKARRTGKPSPSKPDGAVVRVLTGRCRATMASGTGTRGRMERSSTLTAGMPCSLVRAVVRCFGK